MHIDTGHNFSETLSFRDKLIGAELKSLESDIFQNENKQIQLKNNLIKLKKEYARMLVFAQRNKDAYSTLMFIFASTDFNQAYSRLKYMQQRQI